MIDELILCAKDHFGTDFLTEYEKRFSVVVPMLAQTYTVNGVADAIILDKTTRAQVMTWEFKHLRDDLTNKHIAQLVVVMRNGINAYRSMATKCPKRFVGFLTSGREWIMVTATLMGGEYIWTHTPSLSTILPADDDTVDGVVDVDVCGQVAKLLCFAFSNAISLQADILAAVLSSFKRLDLNGPDGESGANPPDDETNDADDENDGQATRGPGGVLKEAGGGGPNLRSKAGKQNRRPLGDVDSNRTAPLTMRNVETNGAMTWSQKPLDRFISAPTFSTHW